MKWEYTYNNATKAAFLSIVNEETNEILAQIGELEVEAWDGHGEPVKEFFSCYGETMYDFIFSVRLKTLDAVRFFSLWCEMEGYEEKTPTEPGLWEYDEDGRIWK